MDCGDGNTDWDGEKFCGDGDEIMGTVGAKIHGIGVGTGEILGDEVGIGTIYFTTSHLPLIQLYCRRMFCLHCYAPTLIAVALSDAFV